VTGWRLSGRYVEACSCEAICPCRQVGGRSGSRSQFQLCQFALAWTIESGHCDEVDLGGLQAVMAGYWDEDEPGVPWRVRLYVDERGDEAQRAALADIFLGRLGGTPAAQYTPAIKEVYGVSAAGIDVVHDRGRQQIRVGEVVSVIARGPFPSDEAVTCGIPGHDQAGEELLHETMKVHDAPLDFEFHGRCGFASRFDYHA
jgi:hypothetical protein